MLLDKLKCCVPLGLELSYSSWVNSMFIVPDTEKNSDVEKTDSSGNSKFIVFNSEIRVGNSFYIGNNYYKLAISRINGF